MACSGKCVAKYMKKIGVTMTIIRVIPNNEWMLLHQLNGRVIRDPVVSQEQLPALNRLVLENDGWDSVVKHDVKSYYNEYITDIADIIKDTDAKHHTAMHMFMLCKYDKTLTTNTLKSLIPGFDFVKDGNGCIFDQLAELIPNNVVKYYKTKYTNQ